MVVFCCSFDAASVPWTASTLLLPTKMLALTSPSTATPPTFTSPSTATPCSPARTTRSTTVLAVSPQILATLTTTKIDPLCSTTQCLFEGVEGKQHLHQDAGVRGWKREREKKREKRETERKKKKDRKTERERKGERREIEKEKRKALSHSIAKLAARHLAACGSKASDGGAACSGGRLDNIPLLYTIFYLLKGSSYLDWVASVRVNRLICRLYVKGSWDGSISNDARIDDATQYVTILYCITLGN